MDDYQRSTMPATSTMRKGLSVFVACSLVTLVLFIALPVAAQGYQLSSFFRGEERVRAVGTAEIDGAGLATNSGELVDVNRDGNTVYLTTRFFSGLFPFPVLDIDNTGEIENVGIDYNHSMTGMLGGTVVVIACAQMGFPIPDSCDDVSLRP